MSKHHLTGIFIFLITITVPLTVFISQQQQHTEQHAATSTDPIQNEPLSQPTYLDQSSYFQKYGFITSIDTMKITRDRSFPGLAANVIVTDVNDFTTQMPNANTITDDVYFDNTTVFREWADAIHSKGKHVWFRGHLCQWENCTGYTHNTDPANYTQNLISWLNNPDIKEAIQSGDIFDPCSEPADQNIGDANIERILLYTTKAAHDAFTAQGKTVLIVHSLSESSFTDHNILDDVVRKSGSVITIDSYPEDETGANYNDPQATAARWKQQLDQITGNYATIINNNNVKLMIGETGFPNNPNNVSDSTKVAVNQANYSLFMNYPSIAGTNYWVGPGDNNAGGKTYLFLDATNFDSPGWTINATGKAINTIYGAKLAGQIVFTKPTQTNATATVVAGSTAFNIAVLLHGLGNAGDNANPQGKGNQNPLHQQRNATINILNSTNQVVATKQGNVNYDALSGTFKGTTTLNSIPSGSYLVVIKIPEYLSKQIPGIQTITSNPAITLPSVSLVTGDINNDNQLDILDYNLLISCYGTKQTTASCKNPPNQSSSGADITDDGTIDGADYNLFLRELSVQKGSQ